MPPPSPSQQTASSPGAMLPRRSPAAYTDDFLYSQLIPYIGNKRKLLPLICEAVHETGLSSGTFVDLFSGSGVVSRYAKQAGFQVVSNDWEPYAFEINRCFAALNEAPKFAALGGAAKALAVLNALAADDGYIARHFCPECDAFPDPSRERCFFTRANGARIDAIRQQIGAWEMKGLIDEAERSYLLAPLLYAASYVSNTSGLFKAFHHGWGGRTGTALYRILSDLYLREPVLFDNGLRNETWRMDAQLAAERLDSEGIRADIVYLDPPYNQHPYASNYHLLNTIALWDKPAIDPAFSRGGKSAIRTDWRVSRRSAYNCRREAAAAYARLLTTINARFILTSYSTDGTIPLRELLEISAGAGQMTCVLEPYKRYRVSAQRRSRKPVNVEFVLIVDCSRPPAARDAALCERLILNAEETALLHHRETAVG